MRYDQEYLDAMSMLLNHDEGKGLKIEKPVVDGYKITIPANTTSLNNIKAEPIRIEKIPIYVNRPGVDRIIYSGNKTIVLWKDKTKTIVACAEGETYDEFDGFTAALAKKIYGSTCAVKREIRKHKCFPKES